MELSNLTVAELWAMRELLRGAQSSAQSSKHEVEGELQGRLNMDEGESKLPLGAGLFVTFRDRVDWQYDNHGINRLHDFLVNGGIITEDEWGQAIKYMPKVSAAAINRWSKIPGVKALIDQARMGKTGRAELEGPSIEELQKLIPDVVAEAAGKL